MIHQFDLDVSKSAATDIFYLAMIIEILILAYSITNLNLQHQVYLVV